MNICCDPWTSGRLRDDHVWVSRISVRFVIFVLGNCSVRDRKLNGNDAVAVYPGICADSDILDLIFPWFWTTLCSLAISRTSSCRWPYHTDVPQDPNMTTFTAQVWERSHFTSVNIRKDDVRPRMIDERFKRRFIFPWSRDESTKWFVAPKILHSQQKSRARDDVQSNDIPSARYDMKSDTETFGDTDGTGIQRKDVIWIDSDYCIDSLQSGKKKIISFRRTSKLCSTE